MRSLDCEADQSLIEATCDGRELECSLLGNEEPLASVVGEVIPVAVGVAGVFVETHQDPDNAPSDGPNMVSLDKMEALLRKLMALDGIAKA